MEQENAFAKKWLSRLGHKIYNSRGDEILTFDGQPDYPILPLNSHLKATKDFEDEDNEPTEDEALKQYVTIGPGDLEELGFVVCKFPVNDSRWSKGQRWYYKLARKKTTVIGIGRTATQQAVHIIHDPIRKRVRIQSKAFKVLGKGRLDSDVGDWVYYDMHAEESERNSLQDIPMAQKRLLGTMRYNDIEASLDKPDIIPVKELPVLWTSDKYLLCLPKETAEQTSPVPRMLIVGQPGMGKTFINLAICSRILYKFQDRMVFLLDALDQLFAIAKPQKNDKFKEQLEAIGEGPRPMPVVMFYMASNTLKDYNMHFTDEGVSFKVAVDIKDFLDNYDFYTEGMDLELTAKRYLNDYKQDFAVCTTKQEIRQVMEARIPNSEKDHNQSMIYKYENSFGTIFSMKFTSNMYQGDPLLETEWTVIYKDGKVDKLHPIIACYEAGLVPILNVSACRDKIWFRNAAADLLDRMLQHQINKGKDNQKRVWVIEDEMQVIYEMGGRKDRLTNMNVRIFRQGRLNKMGFMGNTQSYSKLDPDMKDNATHLFCCRIQDSKERAAIGRNFKLDKEVYEQLESLKKFEVMAISREPWVIYDKFGRKVTDERILKKRYWRGMAIPPVCDTYSPQKKNGVENNARDTQQNEIQS